MAAKCNSQNDFHIIPFITLEWLLSGKLNLQPNEIHTLRYDITKNEKIYIWTKMKLLQSSIVMFKSSAEFYTILYTNKSLESMYKCNSDFEV